MQRAPISLRHPCGNYPLDKGIVIISTVECIFGILSLIINFIELGIYASSLQDDTTKVLLGVYIFINLMTIINAGILLTGVKKNNLRKCHAYFFISIIMFLVTFATLIIHACSYSSVKMFNYYYIVFPLWLMYRPYSLWLVKCFIVELIKEKRAIRMRAGSTVKVKPYQYKQKQGSSDTLQSLTKPQHGFESILEELNFNADDEILMSQLSIDYSQPLKTGDNFAVSRGSLDLGNGKFADVAIKIFKPTLDVKGIKRMISEAKILAVVSSHSNIIKYHGVGLENIHKGKIILVLEYCPKGHLEPFLQGIDNESFVDKLVGDEYDCYIQENLYENIMTVAKEKFSSLDLLRWSGEIASGMEFLHSNKIIHGNLATKNIIVSDRNTMKIGQFTVAAHLYTAERHTTKNDVMKDPFPWRWMAVECMENIDELNFTEKSDVWSYGVTIWEIFSMALSQPYEGMSVSDFFPKLKQGYRLERPCYASTEVYDIMKKCWQRELRERPSFGTLCETFARILSSLMQASDSEED